MPEHTFHAYTSWTGYVGEYGLDTGKSASTTEGRFFRPPWQLEEEYQRGLMTPRHYRERYLAVLRERYAARPTILHDLVRQEYVVLTCDCEPGTVCHRHFAAYVLKRLAESQGIDTARTVELVKDQPFPSIFRPYRLMIAGSREAGPKMLAFARELVRWASEQGWEIVVGDAPGVDEAVVRACDEFGVYATVAGLGAKPRNGGAQSGGYTRVQGDYTRRDRQLCAWANEGYYLWNGRSRGTPDACRQVKSLGKPATLVPFDGDRLVMDAKACETGRQVHTLYHRSNGTEGAAAR